MTDEEAKMQSSISVHPYLIPGFRDELPNLLYFRVSDAISRKVELQIGQDQMGLRSEKKSRNQ